jgi:hypothetical protein
MQFVVCVYDDADQTASPLCGWSGTDASSHFDTRLPGKTALGEHHKRSQF